MTRLIFLFFTAFATFPCQAGWQSLFNGKDLTGWAGDPRLWRVEDGVLIGETDDAGRKIDTNTFLIWQGGEPGDFELQYRARVTGNNSGVQYRSRITDPAKWVVGGYQMDLHPEANYLGMLYEEKGRGIACQRGQRVKLGVKPELTGSLDVPQVDLGVWNSYRIVAQGNILRHFINGKLAAEIQDNNLEKRSAKGVIALQLHAGPAMKTEFKDLRIQMGDKEPTGGPPTAGWIWQSTAPAEHEKVFFRREFQLPRDVASASVTVICDDWSRLFVNGKDLGMASDWINPRTYDLMEHLKLGSRNVMALEGRNERFDAGLALRFTVALKSGKRLHIVSDGSWSCSKEAPEGWQNQDFDASGWQKAELVAKMGDRPWGAIMPPEVEDHGSREDLTNSYQVAPGFKLERLYRVPSDQGSWVSITMDGNGRLLCSDQIGKIYRVNLSDDPAGVTTAVALPIPLKGAQGLLWNDGVLWVSVNEGEDQSGVWRVTDSDGDGELDKPELIMPMKGRGEHGPHSLVLAPDGKSIFFVAGNHTDLPDTSQIGKSFVTRSWAEDQLLPRRPDARGHARDRMAPGGWIARFTPDGKNWQLFASGFRNNFDMAFNQDGELFAYDADMEWDLGMPWYRPTRICHVLPGAEFGWRNGTGKWPDYYEDSVAPQLNIGPGSPAGMVSGKGVKFPEKYQRAIFALDWTFATLYAIHLTPDHAGYRAEREDFIVGKGLPLTDVTIGKDGAMYFLTGGRQIDSALWRVTYTGNESTEPVVYRSKEFALMDVAAAPTGLGSPDRITRYEARTALEKDGPKRLRAVVNNPKSTSWQVIGAAIGLARVGKADQAPEILAALDRLSWAKLDLQQKLNWLRAVGLVFARHGEPDKDARAKVLGKIDDEFPATDLSLNRELCRVLSYLQAPGIVARTLTLMDTAGPSPAPDWLDLAKRNDEYGAAVKAMIANLPPAEVVHYVYCLRVVKGPWHGDERKRFFSWLAKLAQNRGGASYGGFIADLRKETLITCTPEERAVMENYQAVVSPNPFTNLPQIKGPGHDWTVDEVTKLSEGGVVGGNRERGKDIFRAALCAACHRFGGEGGSVGPDLSSLAGRFVIHDIAESILEPNKVISDQYAFDRIIRRDGTEVTGKIIEEKDEKWIIATNPFDFTQTTEIERNEIKEIKRSPVSPMPAGLINRLNRDELKDLLTYLLGK